MPGRRQRVLLNQLLQFGAGEIGLVHHDLQDESVAHPPASTVQEYFCRSGGEPERAGNLLGGKAELGDHDDRGRVPGGEPGHTPLYLLSELGQLREGAGPRPGVGELVGGGVVEDGNPATGAQLIGGKIPGNGQQPRPETSRILEAAQVAQCPEKRVLHDVSGSLAVVHLAVRHGPDNTRMSPVKLGKRLRVARPDGLDELRVASRRCRRHHGRNGSGPGRLAIVATAACLVVVLLATLVIGAVGLPGPTARAQTLPPSTTTPPTTTGTCPIGAVCPTTTTIRVCILACPTTSTPPTTTTLPTTTLTTAPLTTVPTPPPTTTSTTVAPTTTTTTAPPTTTTTAKPQHVTTTTPTSAHHHDEAEGHYNDDETAPRDDNNPAPTYDHDDKTPSDNDDDEAPAHYDNRKTTPCHDDDATSAHDHHNPAAPYDDYDKAAAHDHDHQAAAASHDRDDTALPQAEEAPGHDDDHCAHAPRNSHNHGAGINDRDFDNSAEGAAHHHDNQAPA